MGGCTAGTRMVRPAVRIPRDVMPANSAAAAARAIVLRTVGRRHCTSSATAPAAMVPVSPRAIPGRTAPSMKATVSSPPSAVFSLGSPQLWSAWLRGTRPVNYQAPAGLQSSQRQRGRHTGARDGPGQQIVPGRDLGYVFGRSGHHAIPNDHQTGHHPSGNSYRDGAQPARFRWLLWRTTASEHRPVRYSRLATSGQQQSRDDDGERRGYHRRLAATKGAQQYHFGHLPPGHVENQRKSSRCGESCRENDCRDEYAGDPGQRRSSEARRRFGKYLTSARGDQRCSTQGDRKNDVGGEVLVTPQRSRCGVSKGCQSPPRSPPAHPPPHLARAAPPATRRTTDCLHKPNPRAAPRSGPQLGPAERWSFRG